MDKKRCGPLSYGIKMLNAALTNQAKRRDEENQSPKRSRFDAFDVDPDDPFDVMKSKPVIEWNAEDPLNDDCDNSDSDYVPNSAESESDSQEEIPIQCIPPETTSTLMVQGNSESSGNCIPPETTTSTMMTQDNSESSGNIKKPKRPCIYCGTFQAQLVRHLKRRHQDKEAVAAAVKLPNVEQTRAFADMRKLGIYQCNVSRREENSDGPLLKERRQGTCSVVMCSGCKGFFDSKSIWKHKKHCFSDGQPQSVNFSSLSKEAKNLDLPEDFRTQIMDAFRKDAVGTLCRNDKVILLMGKKLWAKSERKEKHTIMAEMRLYANIIMEMRKYTLQDNITGEDVIDREHFESLNKSIVTLTTKESTENSMKSGLKLRIGFLLKKVIKIMKGYYILNSNEDKEKEVDRFATVLDLNWDFIFYSAQLRCELRRNDLRKPTAMPNEEDLKQLRNFMLQEMNQLLESYKMWDKHDYVWMRDLVVSRLTMFNARRGGEPARLTVKEWEEADQNMWVDPQHIEHIKDDLEKALVNKYKLAYQAGKGSRKLVPLLIPNDTINPMKKLVVERRNFVSDQNVFLFANISNSNHHVIGWNCLKSVTSSMGSSLQSPHLLIADKFRHRMSTLYALLDVNESEREAFYRHMGHSAAMNKNVYQCPLALRELTKVGAFLKNVDEQPNVSEVQSNKSKEISCDVPCDEDDNDDVPQDEVPCDEDDNDAVPQNEVEAIEPRQISCETEAPRKLSKRNRTYTKWNTEDTGKVKKFFKSYILAEGVNVSQGSLPPKEMVIEFLSKHQMFDYLTEKEKVPLIKTKVFNERKKARMNRFNSC